MPDKCLLKVPWAQRHSNSFGFLKTGVRDRVENHTLVFGPFGEFGLFGMRFGRSLDFEGRPEIDHF